MNKKKIIIVTLIMYILNIFSKYWYELSIISTLSSMALAGVSTCIIAFLYVKMKNEMCGDEQDLLKQFNKLILTEWFIIVSIEFIISWLIQGIDEFLFVLWAVFGASIYNLIGILIFIKLIEVAYRRYEKLNMNIPSESTIKEYQNNEDEKEVLEIKGLMYTVVIVLITAFICWFLKRAMYVKLFPISENVLTMLPVLIIGIVSQFLPLICAILYVIYGHNFNKKGALWTWILSNVLIGGAFAIYDWIKGYRYGNFVIDIINMGYFRTIVGTLVLVVGTILLIILLKKYIFKSKN